MNSRHRPRLLTPRVGRVGTGRRGRGLATATVLTHVLTLPTLGI